MGLAEAYFWIALAAFGKHCLAENFRQRHKLNYHLLIALEESPSFLKDVERRAKLKNEGSAYPLEELVEPFSQIKKAKRFLMAVKPPQSPPFDPQHAPLDTLWGLDNRFSLSTVFLSLFLYLTWGDILEQIR